MNDIEYALWDVKSALDSEIAELQTYLGLIGDDVLKLELESKIEGMRIAQVYLHRKMNECGAFKIN